MDAAFGIFDVSGGDGSVGNLLVNVEAFGILPANDAAVGNFDVSDVMLGIPFGVLTNPPIPPTVFDEKLGFLTPDMIPSIPFGFEIFTFGILGIFAFGNSTFGKFGKFGFVMFGGEIFGISAIGRLGTDGVVTEGKLGDGNFGIEKSGIY